MAAGGLKGGDYNELTTFNWFIKLPFLLKVEHHTSFGLYIFSFSKLPTRRPVEKI